MTTHDAVAAPGRASPRPWHAVVLFVLTALAFVAPALRDGPTMGAVDIVTAYAPYEERAPDPVPADNPLQGDQAIQLPLPAEFWASVRGGELQLWEPDIAGGTPLLPAVYNRILSPLHWTFAVLPAPWAPTATVFLGLLVAQLGVYALARRLGLGVAGAALAGVGYAFSGPMSAFTLRFHEFFLLPAWLFAIHGLVTDERRRWGFAALTGVMTAATWLAGFPGAAVMCSYTAAAWGAYLLVSTARRRAAGTRWRFGVGVGALAAVAAGAGLLVASLQLLPTLEFLDTTLARTRTYGVHHLPTSALAMVLSGRWFGAPQDADWRDDELVNVIESASGFGILVLLGLVVLVAGLRARRRPETERVLTWFVAPTAILVLHATYLARPVLGWFQRLPLLDETLFTRARAIAVLMIALLAGHGLDRVLDRRSRRDDDQPITRPALALRLMVAYVPLLVLVGLWHAVPDVLAGPQTRAVAKDLVVPVLAAAVGLGVLWLARRGPAVAALGVVVALAVELQFGALGLTPAADRFYPDDPALDVLRQDTGPGGPYRFFDRPNLALYGHTGAYLDLSDALAHWPAFGPYQQVLERSDPHVAEASEGKAVFEPAFSDELDLGSPALDAISAGWFLADLAAPPEQAGMAEPVGTLAPDGTGRVTRGPDRPARALLVDGAVRDSTCRRGWVEVTVGDHTSRRLLRELPAGEPWTFPLPDLDLRVGTSLRVEGTHCDVATIGDEVRARPVVEGSDLELVSVDGWQAYRRPAARPRLELASATTVVPDPQQRLDRLAARDDDTIVLSDGSAATYAGGRVRFVADTPDRVEVAVDSDGPGLLVLRDVDAPGWHATVDRAPVPIRRADHAFRAVSVPDGPSTVVFEYRPASFVRGAWLALAGTLGLIALGGVALWRHRHPA